MLKTEIDPDVNVVVVFNFLDELKRIMENP